MKKKLLVALFALVSCVSMHAYKIRIDNDTDGTEATSVSVEFFSNNLLAQKPSIVKPDKEKSFKFKSRKFTITAVRVTGIDGLADRKAAFFEIPQGRLNKDIKIDVDVELDEGVVRLMLSQDK